MAELANGRRDSFETPLERDLDLFLGVGGSGRSPLNPPTPRHEGAGVRVDQETKWKFIVVYREVVDYIVKYSLRRPGARGWVALTVHQAPQFACIFTIDPATWPGRAFSSPAYLQ